MIRLDKYLCDMNVGTRSELKKSIRKGLVQVNKEIIKSPDYKVGEDDYISYLGKEIKYETMVYYMLNKPAGVVSATEDNLDKTVIDLLKEHHLFAKGVFPVGRLDKDTEGLLLLTNNGPLSHELLSPKKHVDKVYYARINGHVTKEDVFTFQQGIDIGEKSITLPAALTIIKSDEISEVEITIREGKFHQIKRMFHVIDKEVLYLKRLQMGNLHLDTDLPLGHIRPLNKEEINKLCSKI